MHAYLIVSTNQEATDHTLKQLITQVKALRMDFTLTKIDEVRRLTNFVRLTITQPTAVVISDINQASLQAQNAFLKQLEEPQPNLYYLLTATNLYQLAPTIVSRCRVIKLPTIPKTPSQPLQGFPRLSLGQKLQAISQVRRRDEALEYTSALLETYHRQLIKPAGFDQIKTASRNLELINQCYGNLKGNGNIFLHLANLAINLSPD